MRTRAFGFAFAAIALVALGCSEDDNKAVRLAERLQKRAEGLSHRRLPPPHRARELGASDGGRRSPLAAEIAPLKGDQGVVAALTAMLRDQNKRVAAAYVLAEIGGPRAAEALWSVYREMLKRVKVVTRFRETSDGVWEHAGIRTKSVDHAFFFEVRMGLCYVGRPVARAMIDRAETALTNVRTLQENGQDNDAGRAPRRRHRPGGRGELRSALDGV